MPIPAVDRAVLTTTDMDSGHKEATSQWVQFCRLSDLSLLRSVALPPGPRGEEHYFTGEPKLLPDGQSVYVHTFNCGLYLVRGVDRAEPSATFVTGQLCRKGTPFTTSIERYLAVKPLERRAGRQITAYRGREARRTTAVEHYRAPTFMVDYPPETVADRWKYAEADGERRPQLLEAALREQPSAVERGLPPRHIFRESSVGSRFWPSYWPAELGGASASEEGTRISDALLESLAARQGG